MAAETAKIKLYRKTYQLPRLNRPDLLILQDQIQERQQLIKTGKRVRNTWLGLRKKEEPLDFEETFQELERLVGDYNQLIRFLTDHKDEYRRFFLSLTEEIKEAVAVKCQKLAETERKRQSLENSIGSAELRDTLRLQKQQIFRTVILVGRASLLMLKKIDLISESIQKLAEDQDTQKRVFSKMIGELNGYKQVYQLQIELDNLEKEAIEMAKVAINLEQYLKPIIGQFQGLIDQVVTIDGELSRSVSEVESLVQNILSSESAVSFRKNENLSASLLNFLVTSEEKRGRLASALERAEQEGWQWTEVEIPDEEIELETAIQRINNHVIERVRDFSTSVVGDSPIPPQTQPETAPGNKTSFTENYQSSVISYQLGTAPGDKTSFTENLPKGVTLEMVSLPAGKFLMGSSESDSEKPPHQVKVNSFAIGKYPITQAQYQAVMGDNPSRFKNNPQNPVENVSWNDAQAFCQKLSQITGKTYRLPTEAEWEYACRAGTTTRYYFGDDDNQLGNYAWYDGNPNDTTHPVGQKKPNGWGLYDMSGNVWEWCEDDWHDSYKNAPDDGTAWIDNDNRSQSEKCLRGGSWLDFPYNCRSAIRSRINPGIHYSVSGFRVACVSPRL
ncbi:MULTISPECIES: SUMF1/EgtB/PvdO family nonheme iron enzyme [unclassified Microcystis]|uniref:SUMF1/EgtB/PvdO family nonheme iron enzyme n=1 Tax=unclassified Microcystis TaxID=2643300 RepID=UPI00258FC5E6|nr:MULTISPECIES: SUMF1/EgtB/PvdO family nonheme iron enzyme [unclassified Microcystis]MCA2762046.1 SUMF1/EgtB/PvdO family nonheme iron enzyme [Microcystis sp. M151S2]MCA2641984.1 SUMF1/EgtB/PvdO family nonheme iron enzyme [Microcystis sp. M087S2]MCA2672678.1 SUMF1/EgtB/PvdO family nonheme iron enzyme [Microcystis sp. M080S2]MCA2687863.1 SUMF1/EgtB/PvdO family nonheme iron enzyme [Microcystis sp. M037S2]MCA2734808.1 SUMF1/EgtB/PvdO family nonheme iron enzyme [Microcystis sp. M158S2]